MPNTPSSRAADFIAAARHLEHTIREAFVGQGRLIQATSRLIHAIQRERGASNLYVANSNPQHGRLRQSMVDETALSLAEFLAALPTTDSLDRTLLGHRLLLQLAAAMQALDELDNLREQINQQQLTPAAVIHHYSRIIHTLLCVVFEIADIAAQPAMARTLIALVNIMQCKELSGQERATGTAAFAGNHISTTLAQQWQQLIKAQEQSLDIFHQFADEHAQQLCGQIIQLPDYGEFESLRRRACTSVAGSCFPEHTGERWFHLSSQRIDALKDIEDYLIQILQQQCTQQMEASGDSEQHTAADNRYFVVLGTAVDMLPLEDTQPLRHYHNDAISPHIGRTMIELLYQQACRLQKTETELADTRNALTEGKRIARAKALLIHQRNINENQAHRLLQQIAMNQNRTLGDVASLLLALEEQ